jgi:(p)ppGpp synthase/HD superfamily hydrolase
LRNENSQQNTSREENNISSLISLLQFKSIQLISTQEEPGILYKEISQSQKSFYLQELANSYSYSTDLIYVLTRGGDVKKLQVGSTPLDFAYHLHTEMGHQCYKAEVNGQEVALNTPLQNGDTVEIIKSETSYPKEKWLESLQTSSPYLVTPRAINKVRQWFRKKSYEESWEKSRERGREKIQKIFKSRGLDRYLDRGNNDDLKTDIANDIAKELNCSDKNHLYVALGYGILPNMPYENLLEEEIFERFEQKILSSLQRVEYRRGKNLLVKKLGGNNFKLLEKIDSENYLEQITINGISIRSLRDLVVNLGSEYIVFTNNLQSYLEKQIEKFSLQKSSQVDDSYYKIYKKNIEWTIGGESQIPYRFASCCSRKIEIGDNVGKVKYVESKQIETSNFTRYFLIHSRECSNIRNSSKLLEVTNYIKIKIETKDRIGMQRDIAEYLARENLNIIEAKVEVFKQKAVFVKSITVTTWNDVKRLEGVISKLKQNEDVIDAHFMAKQDLEIPNK